MRDASALQASDLMASEDLLSIFHELDHKRNVLCRKRNSLPCRTPKQRSRRRRAPTSCLYLLGIYLRRDLTYGHRRHHMWRCRRWANVSAIQGLLSRCANAVEEGGGSCRVLFVQVCAVVVLEPRCRFFFACECVPTEPDLMLVTVPTP
jgi:hypothetical protein